MACVSWILSFFFCIKASLIYCHTFKTFCYHFLRANYGTTNFNAKWEWRILNPRWSSWNRSHTQTRSSFLAQVSSYRRITLKGKPFSWMFTYPVNYRFEVLEERVSVTFFRLKMWAFGPRNVEYIHKYLFAVLFLLTLIVMFYWFKV